jgi:hypothetical protein
MARSGRVGRVAPSLLLDRLGKAEEIDWERASLDSASVAAPGGQKTCPNPTDKGKSGSNRHIVVDREDLPLPSINTRGKESGTAQTVTGWVGR